MKIIIKQSSNKQTIKVHRLGLVQGPSMHFLYALKLALDIDRAAKRGQRLPLVGGRIT